jgi:hypothetical protein
MLNRDRIDKRVERATGEGDLARTMSGQTLHIVPGRWHYARANVAFCDRPMDHKVNWEDLRHPAFCKGCVNAANAAIDADEAEES